MNTAAITLQAVQSASQRAAAQRLIGEYLRWVADVARQQHGLSFDVEAMLRADVDDAAKFAAPHGRCHLIHAPEGYVGVGCLKRLGAHVGELQRMYVQPRARRRGAARLLLERLLADARTMGLRRVRLESLKALGAAHALYHAAGFNDIDPYADNSMQAYQAADALPAYRASAVFMEITLQPGGA